MKDYFFLKRAWKSADGAAGYFYNYLSFVRGAGTNYFYYFCSPIKYYD